MVDIDWTLEQCCTKAQYTTLGIILGWSVVVAILWTFPVLLPFKMLTVFLHEFGHASATWCTCGRVKGIKVHTNEGGVTTSVGGNRWCILPAGYLGSCAWGVFFLLMGSYNLLTLRISAGILAVLLVVVLIAFAKNCSLRLLCCGFVVIIGATWAATEFWKTIWPLRILMLLIGVMSCLFSLWDIWDDLIRRKEPSSDAYKFAQMTHCNSRFCGLIWGIISLAFEALAIYVILINRNFGSADFS